MKTNGPREGPVGAARSRERDAVVLASRLPSSERILFDERKMSGKPGRKRRGDKARRRHRFFLNPRRDKTYARCPVCGTRTNFRSFFLVVRIDPGQLLLASKPCRYCSECDLIIAAKRELDAVVADGLGRQEARRTGEGYSVTGTLDEADWLEGSRGALTAQQITERMYVFRDKWNFDDLP